MTKPAIIRAQQQRHSDGAPAATATVEGFLSLLTRKVLTICSARKIEAQAWFAMTPDQRADIVGLAAAEFEPFVSRSIRNLADRAARDNRRPFGESDPQANGDSEQDERA